MIKECENCWYYNKCIVKNGMKSVCMDYEHTFKSFLNSNIPHLLWSRKSITGDENDKNFQALKQLAIDIKNLYENKRNIYLYSNEFNSNLNDWLIKILQNYIFAFRAYQFNNKYENCVYYIDAGRFKEIVQAQVDNKELFYNTVQCMQGCELLGIDNIDKLKGHGSSQEKLVNILEYRNFKRHKSNVFTSHISPSLLKKNGEAFTWNPYLVNNLLNEGDNGSYEV